MDNSNKITLIDKEFNNAESRVITCLYKHAVLVGDNNLEQLAQLERTVRGELESCKLNIHGVVSPHYNDAIISHIFGDSSSQADEEPKGIKEEESDKIIVSKAELYLLLKEVELAILSTLTGYTVSLTEADEKTRNELYQNLTEYIKHLFVCLNSKITTGDYLKLLSEEEEEADD